MGCSASTISAEQLSKLLQAEHAAPPWCHRLDKPIVITPEQGKIIEGSWQRVMSGKAKPYIEAHAANNTITPMVFFYQTYYGRFFDMMPEVRPMFRRSMRSQGKMLANVIRFIVHQIQQDDKVFIASLQHLAAAHNKIGVKAEYYSTTGLVLLYAMRKCLGEEEWSPELEEAWRSTYSRMMQVIIPVVIDGTLPDQLTNLADSLYEVKAEEGSDSTGDGQLPEKHHADKDKDSKHHAASEKHSDKLSDKEHTTHAPGASDLKEKSTSGSLQTGTTGVGGHPVGTDGHGKFGVVKVAVNGSPKQSHQRVPSVATANGDARPVVVQAFAAPTN